MKKEQAKKIDQQEEEDDPNILHEAQDQAVQDMELEDMVQAEGAIQELDPEEPANEEQIEDEQVQDDPQVEPEEDKPQPIRRSTRTRMQTQTYIPTMEGQTYIEEKESSHLLTQAHPEELTLDYDEDDAIVLARAMTQMKDMVLINTTQGLTMVMTYSLQQALKKFGKKAEQAGFKEVKQMHDQVCFRPILIEELTEEEQR